MDSVDTNVPTDSTVIVETLTGPTGPVTSVVSTNPTGPTGPNPNAPKPLVKTPPLAPHPIATMSELTTSRNAIIKKENNDRAALSVIANPQRGIVRSSLINWTSKGFPANFPIFSVGVMPPPICSDGVQRSFADYVTYLFGTPISAQIDLLQPQIVGIKLSYVISANTIRILVSN